MYIRFQFENIFYIIAKLVLWIADHVYTRDCCRFKAVAAKSKLDLVNQGFTEFTIEDFHNTVSRNTKNLSACCCN